MSKKFGIVTFHHALSYGAVLQTYALQNTLFDLGIDNEVVNYRCKFIEDRAKVFKYIKGKSLRNYAFSFLHGRSIVKERKNSEYFDNTFLKMTKPYTQQTISQCTSDFDGFISGSDQVFNPTCVRFDPVYFLNFAKKGQKYSYAASFGIKELPQDKLEAYRERLADFSELSVREESGKKIVKNLLDREAFVHIDPTFLLTQEKWNKIANDDVPKEKYIFIFNVLKPSQLVNYALKLAEEKGMKIIYLSKTKRSKSPLITYIDAVTADKFVGLIKNASYVCTNSFHGNAFSLIYHKNFIVETDNAVGENIRSRELMIKLGLKNRILAHDLTPNIDENTDWSKVEQYLSQEREKSRQYLLSIATQEK